MLLWLVLNWNLPYFSHQMQSLYEYTVSQSGISWWMNKFFGFWITLSLTEFEMWAACNVLLVQKNLALLLTKKIVNENFLSFFSCVELLFDSAWMSAVRPGLCVQFNISSLSFCELPFCRVTSVWNTKHIFLASIKKHCTLY